MASGRIVLSYTTTSDGATSAVVRVTMTYYGNGETWNSSPSSNNCSITLNGTTKSFTHAYTTSTSAQTMGSADFTITKTHSTQSFTASGTLKNYSTVYSNPTASCTVSVGKKTYYTVSYNANGGSGAPSSQTKWYGETLTLSSTAPTRTGYNFKNKWNTKADGTGTNYSSGGSYSANASLTLYAVWENAGPYTITFNANGGTSGSITSLIKNYGTPIRIPEEAEPTREGYVFKGWSTSARGTSVSYTTGSTYSTEASVTLYAVWQEQVITIIYNKNTDADVTDMPSNQTMRYWTDTSINISSDTPQRTDYTFMGWSYLQSGGELIQPGDTFNNPRPQTEITLYAQWDTATITYYYWNNIATPYIQNVAIGSSGNLWSTQSNELPDIVVNNVTYEFSGKWVKLNVGSTSSLTNDSFLKTDNNRESPTGGQTTYTNVQGNNSYAATYQRKSPRPETDSPYMFYIRTNRVFLPEFVSKTESEFAQLEDINGKFISGYVRFTSPYPKGTVVNIFPNQLQPSLTKPASGLLVRTVNNYAITSTVNVTITPGYTGVGGTISGTATIVFKGNYVYMFSCLGDGVTDLNEGTQTITLSWDTDEVIVTNDYGVEVSLAEYVYNLIGVNYVVDINSTGTMLSVGGEAHELTTIDGVERLPVVNYTDNLNPIEGAVVGSSKTMVPQTVTAIQNPLYVINDSDSLVPAITDGIIEDEIVLKPEVARKWVAILAGGGYAE